jgi:hypothetical protein
MGESGIVVRPLDLGAPWRVPRVGATGPEGLVAAANSRIRSRARARLARFLPELATRQIWSAGEPSAPMVWSADLGATGLDGGQIVDFLSAHEQVDGARVTLSSGGVADHQDPAAGVLHPRQHPTMSPSKLSGAGLTAALLGGETAVFNHSDDVHPMLGALADDVGRAFGCQVSIYSYLSIGDASLGFGGHWDEQDVIAVPLLGAKRWEVAEPLAPHPLLGAVAQGYSGRVVTTTVLEPGRALVIPRGWGHRVTALAGQFSFHITIGLVRPRGLRLLGQLVERLARHPELRADVDSEPEVGGADFWSTAVATVDDDDVAAAAALVVARMGARPFDAVSAGAALAAGRWTGLWLRPRVPAALCMQAGSEGDDRVVLGGQPGPQRGPGPSRHRVGGAVGR